MKLSDRPTPRTKAALAMHSIKAMQQTSALLEQEAAALEEALRDARESILDGNGVELGICTSALREIEESRR